MELDELAQQRPDIAQAFIDQGRQTERDRIQAVLDHEAASNREALAKYLAFETELDMQTMVAVLQAAPKTPPPIVSPPEPNHEQKVSTPASTPTPTSIPTPASPGFEQVMAALNNPEIEPAYDEVEDPTEALAQRIARGDTDKNKGGAR